MRWDMAKVIVERPRHGSHMRDKDRKGRRRDVQRLGLNWLKRERVGTTHKSFNEHLAPLRRYLDSQVGRPWDAVHAEIRKHIRTDSVVQKHVLTHVDQYVVTDVLEIDGVACHSTGWFSGQPILWGWFVCPRTGLLRRVKTTRTKRKIRERRTAATVVPNPVRVDERRVCRVIANRWHLVEVRPLKKPAGMPNAVWVETCRDARRDYGDVVEAVSQRPLSKREMEQLPVPVDLWKQRRWWTSPRKAKRA